MNLGRYMNRHGTVNPRSGEELACRTGRNCGRRHRRKQLKWTRRRITRDTSRARLEGIGASTRRGDRLHSRLVERPKGRESHLNCNCRRGLGSLRTPSGLN